MQPAHGRPLPAALADWLHYSSVWVAICAVAFTAAHFLIFTGGRLDPPCSARAAYALFVGFSAFSAYTLDRLLLGWSPEDALNRHAAVAWQSERKRTLLFLCSLSTVAAGSALAFLWSALPATAHVLLVAGAVLSAAYSIPLPWIGRLQDYGAVKPALAAGAWTVGTTTIPLLACRSPAILLYGGSAAAFLLLSANAILCDALDIRGDTAAARRTLAVRWGAVLTRRVCARVLWTALAMATGFMLFVLLQPEAAAGASAGQSGWEKPATLLCMAYGPAFASLALLASVKPRDGARAEMSTFFLRGAYDGSLCVPALGLIAVSVIR